MRRVICENLRCRVGIFWILPFLSWGEPAGSLLGAVSSGSLVNGPGSGAILRMSSLAFTSIFSLKYGRSRTEERRASTGRENVQEAKEQGPAKPVLPGL